MQKSKPRKSRYFQWIIKLLTDYPETRYSDFVLYNKFLQVVLHIDTKTLSAYDMLNLLEHDKLPDWKTIGRNRQTIQSMPQYAHLDCERRRTKSIEKTGRAYRPQKNTPAPIIQKVEKPIIESTPINTVIKKNKITTPLPPYKTRYPV